MGYPLLDDCYVEIHAGSDSPESHDWVEILSRMYMRWADINNCYIDWQEYIPGEEAGLKTSIIKLRGNNAYQSLKKESGIHRIVRISPFDVLARRHTSFASVMVYPVIYNLQMEILDKDIKIYDSRLEQCRVGGQHVGNYQGIKITHIPTGIEVSCSNFRSQHKNKLTAMDILRSRLHAETLEIYMDYQVRSYTLNPEPLVKDYQTGKETTDVQAVLDGDLNQFLG